MGCGGVDNMDAKKNVSIPFSEIVDKNINFLIGSGASYGIAPTLELKIKQANGCPHTVETLGKHFEDQAKPGLMTLLLMHYYVECIKPILLFSYEKAGRDQKQVIESYKSFLKSISVLLNRKRTNKQCNIFTSNYDNCFVQAIESIYKEGCFDFNLNDGAKGFSNKYLSARNFNTVQYETSPFLQHKTEIPQVNLIHLHGSVFWKKEDELTISVDYKNKLADLDSENIIKSVVSEFSNIIANDVAMLEELEACVQFSVDENQFVEQYKKLPIVNPTKWKFHETVFEEHYYQMLRYMSYELEKENSVLIVFGFSFADEHILNIVKRSLSNPKLKIYICCFTEAEETVIRGRFSSSDQIEYISLPDKNLCFEAFNQHVFNEKPKELPEELPF